MDWMLQYGIDKSVLSHASLYRGLFVGRVLSQQRGRYTVRTEQGTVSATLSGKLGHQAQPLQVPVVGDFVMTAGHDDPVIHAVLPRKTLFVRRMPGSPRQPRLWPPIWTRYGSVYR